MQNLTGWVAISPPPRMAPKHCIPTISGSWDGYTDEPSTLRNRMTEISLPAIRCAQSYPGSAARSRSH